MATNEKKSKTVPLNWKEVYFTNCSMVSFNNIDQELGWCKTDFKKIRVDYSYFRSRRENDYYPHYIHNLDNLIRFGGLYPPIQVHADIRRTSLLGATWVYEGGCMLEHGYIKNDFDINEWAAPEFLEQATATKLPEATSLRLG
jgi:hypothetical protein